MRRLLLLHSSYYLQNKVQVTRHASPLSSLTANTQFFPSTATFNRSFLSTILPKDHPQILISDVHVLLVLVDINIVLMHWSLNTRGKSEKPNTTFPANFSLLFLNKNLPLYSVAHFYPEMESINNQTNSHGREPNNRSTPTKEG